MEKMCGRCSQEGGLTLEERIALALSRLPKQLYHCPICKEEHVFTGKVAVIQPPREAISEPKKSSKKEKDTVQLTLF